ncbi:MAG: lipoprotein insertase outer membrane protein LolB [Gammaproteobacteria bacterium]
MTFHPIRANADTIDLTPSKRWLIPALFSLIAGCAATPPVTDAALALEWEARRVKLSAMQDWHLKGRIAFQLDREAWSAILHWQQRRHEYVLRLIAPLGRGTIELTGSDSGVSLRTADNRLLQADDPEALLRENLGWDLPVSGLFYWIRGLPEPDSPADALLLDDEGRIHDLRQNGWQVSYQRYDTASGYDLPGKMTLQNERLKVRLAISDWVVSS